MPEGTDLSEDVLRAFLKLSKKDQLLVRLDLAGKVASAALSKLPRVEDRGAAIRYALSENYIGNQGTQKKRREVFGAYWRLTRKVVAHRERRIKLCR